MHKLHQYVVIALLSSCYLFSNNMQTVRGRILFVQINMPSALWLIAFVLVIGILIGITWFFW